MFKLFLAFLHLLIILGELVQGQCPLVPDGPSNCMELRAEAFLIAENSQFGPVIEGASTNPRGHIFATNYGNSSTRHTTGQLYPEQRLFYVDPILANAYFNGIRFLNENTAFVADKPGHRVVQLNIQVDSEVTSSVVDASIFCANSFMIEPNDLAISKSGTIFTSGQNWVANTGDTDGDVWACLPNQPAKPLELMGRTNGIELNPEETLLYVSESYTSNNVPHTQKIWVYDANVVDGSISGKRLFADFAEIDETVTVDIDGMRCDQNGNLFVTRHGGREVVIFNPDGEVIGKIGLNFPNPTNLEFGGPNGTSLYIVGKCDGDDKGCVDVIEVVTPGRAWTNLQ